MSFEKPYEGLNVVNLSQGVAGPYCGMLLGINGAKVIKVEPLHGDWSRKLMPAYGDNTAFSVAANIGKLSIAVDVKTKIGYEIVDRLCQTADVFLQAFRPGIIDRLGFGYEHMKKFNPGLIYVSISGFGQTGPLKDKPAMDPILQAFTGFMSENHGPDGIPHRTPNIANDMATGLYAQQAVASALYARRDCGRGRHIEVSLMEASANLQSIRLMSAYRDGPYQASMVPNGVFKTKDGWVQIIVLLDKDFYNFSQALGNPELAEDTRFSSAEGRLENGATLNSLISSIIEKETSDFWRTQLDLAGIQNEIVQTYEQFIEHPHVSEVGLISWLTQPGSSTPWPVPNTPASPKYEVSSQSSIAPEIGHHTREILTDLGYTSKDIDAFIANGAVSV